MNVIELVKQILTDCPLMEDFTGGIHVDFTEDKPESFGISSTGDKKLKEDVLGNQTRQHNFVLYAVNQGLNDYDRLKNSTFLLDLAYWLEEIRPGQYDVEAKIGEQTKRGKLLSLTSANAMLFSWQDGTESGPVTYQIQLYAQYKIESEVQ